MSRRRAVYRRPGPRVSLSLDAPSKLARRKPSENVAFRSGLDDQLRLMDNNGDDHEEDRYYLYLPRNLSYCHLCADAVKQHVQTKVKHLTSKLVELGLSKDNTKSISAQRSFWLPRESIGKLNNKLREDNLTSSTSSIESEDSSLSSQFSNDSVQKESHQVPSSELPSILRKCNKRAKSFPPAKKYSGKKVVRFADSLGLELETVRHLMVADRPPFVPSKAFADLHHVVNSLELEADFQNPSTWVDFDYQLRRHCVRLHSVRPTYTTVYGLITVLNLTFHKNVSVRYTTNGWTTYNDVYATYVPPLDDEEPHPDRDNFSFNIFTSASDFYGMRVLKLSFAICYRTEDGKEYWDNNEGLNYSLSGFYKPMTLSAQFKHTWVHFL